jgi:DNA invertase Pin-like site-specific DNA recombinase
MIVRPSGKRVASYERLSKDEAPDAAGIGPIQRQRDQIDKWAGDNGHTIGRRYCDLGGKRHEAESVKRRPQYVQLTADIKAGLWDVLVVEELTRLGFDGIKGIMKVCSFL